MRALRKVAPGAGLEWTDVEEPGCGPWDVKVRVLRAGICGTDLHILDWDSSAEAMCDTVPFTPGHEFYGEVVEAGEEVGDVRVGDRISGEGHVVCGVCRNCRAGRRQMCIRTRSIAGQRDGAVSAAQTLAPHDPGPHAHDTRRVIPPRALRPMLDQCVPHTLDRESRHGARGVPGATALLHVVDRRRGVSSALDHNRRYKTAVRDD